MAGRARCQQWVARDKTVGGGRARRSSVSPKSVPAAVTLEKVRKSMHWFSETM